MKKQLFWMIGAALALTSCSNDEQVAVNPANEITFRTAVQTRTSSNDLYTTANFTENGEFNVTAYFVDENTHTETDPHLNNMKFTWDGGKKAFVSNPTHYWLSDVTSLQGQAWAPVDESVTLSTTDENTYTYQFTVNSDITKQTDFITANIDKENASQSRASSIQLTFAHQLVQIEVNAKNTAEEYTLSIKKAQLGNVLTSADAGKNTLTLAYEENTWTPTWGAVNTSVNYSGEEYGTPIDNATLLSSPQNVMGENQVLMLYPQTITKLWKPDATNAGEDLTIGTADEKGAYIALLAQIKENETTIYPYDNTEKVNEEDYGWIVVPIPANAKADDGENTIVKWEAGNKYIYTLTFANDAAGYKPNGSPVLGKPINFASVVVSEWMPEDDNETTVDMTTTTE